MKNDRLYVTDLDGTLLNSCISLSRYSVNALNALIEKGVAITYATSRSFYTCQKLLEDVQFGLPCITYNGAYVMNAKTGEIFRKNLLEWDVLDFVLLAGKELGLQPFIFGKNQNAERLLYSTPQNHAQNQFIQERLARKDKRLCYDTGKESLDEIITITFLYPIESLMPLQEKVLKKSGAQVSVKLIRDIYCDGYYSLEISNSHANKGDMLLYLGELLGVSMEDVTVFGDQANDEEMFRVAGTRIAVANAAGTLKAMADAVIGSNDEDGVVKYLLTKN